MASAPQIDASALIPLMKGLQAVDADLRKNTNKRLRQAAAECARGLVGDLRAAGASAATPQARLVAKTAAVRSDRVPLVKIGGPRKVGHRKSPAGRLLWGSEQGGKNFAAATGGSYWINPTVQRFQAGPAQGVYLRAVAGILREAGVI